MNALKVYIRVPPERDDHHHRICRWQARVPCLEELALLIKALAPPVSS